MIEITNQSQVRDVLRDLRGGFEIILDGEFRELRIGGQFEQAITVYANRAKVVGLWITASNVIWQAFPVTARPDCYIERQRGAIAMNTDNLSEAKGIINALAIGLGMWGLIFATSYWILRG